MTGRAVRIGFGQRCREFPYSSAMALFGAGAVATAAAAGYDERILILIELAAFCSRDIQQDAAIYRGKFLVELPEERFAAYRLFVGITRVAAIEALGIHRRWRSDPSRDEQGAQRGGK
jgi:hypothetical protein